MLELPAAAATKAAIPLLRAKFITNIIRHLDDSRPVENGLSLAGTQDDRVPKLTNEGEPAQSPAGDGNDESTKPFPPPTLQ